MSEKEKYLRDKLVTLWMKDIGQREDRGKNRSVMIDACNKRMGVKMGEPYCISGLLARGVEVLCTQEELVNPVIMTAGTQKFWHRSPEKYRKLKGMLSLKSDIGILVNKDNAGKGHAFGFKEDETPKKQMTCEYNTSPAGSRDGDGFYCLERVQEGTKTKTYRGSVDVIKWIMDANNLT